MGPPRDWVVVMMEGATGPVDTVSAAGAGGATAESFDAFYRRTVGPMTQVAWALLDDRRVAEDVTHDAYAAVYARYDGLDRAEPYLRVCVINGCKRHLRRAAMAHRHAADDRAEAVEHGYDHLLDLVRQLPSRQRDVVVLRYQLGLTETEIAETLGIAPGSVKVQHDGGLAEPVGMELPADGVLQEQRHAADDARPDDRPAAARRRQLTGLATRLSPTASR